jgi:NhaA family Na+:H+ antiporter
MPQRRQATQVLQFIVDNSLLLVMGALAALIWANLHLGSYQDLSRALHFAVNDVAMVFFFALAMKEVVEAMLPGGPLSTPRQAAVPVLAAVGGMAGPAAIYIGLVSWLGRADLARGWAIPSATDIAFSYLIARIIFRAGHPAIPFLLLLAIADDALGLIVLAVFYPSGVVSAAALAGWLVPALLLAWALRWMGVGSFWAYVLGPGALAWAGLYVGGLHPALAMVPIVPFMPHHTSDLRTFGRREPIHLATLQDFETWWKPPVQFILLAFGFVNAGVPLASVGTVTGVVLVSLVIGKPIGIVLTTLLAGSLGFRRSKELDLAALITMGIAAGIGFTVALFFITASFPPGESLDQAKMGALLSVFAAGLAFVAGRMLGIRRS